MTEREIADQHERDADRDYDRSLEAEYGEKAMGDALSAMDQAREMYDQFHDPEYDGPDWAGLGDSEPREDEEE